MDRRFLILGGFGAIGILSIAAYLRPQPASKLATPSEAVAGKPMLVFVGHEL